MSLMLTACVDSELPAKSQVPVRSGHVPGLTLVGQGAGCDGSYFSVEDTKVST